MTEATLLTDEAALLGACLQHDKAIWLAVDAGLTPDDLQYQRHKAIFAALLELANEGKRPDPILVGQKAQSDDPGIKAHCHALVSACPSVANAKEYVAAVKESAIDRQTHRAVDEVVASGARGTALLEALQEAVYRIERPAKEGAFLSDALQAVYHELDSEPTPALEYPWPDIQNATKGMRPGWLCVLAGEPGHGKTAIALEIAADLLSQGKRILYNSLEMSPHELAVRMAQRVGLSTSALYAGRASSEDAKAVLKLINDQDTRNFRIETNTAIGTFGVLIRRYRPDLFILDHLHLLPWEKGDASGYGSLTRATRELKLLARRYDVPVLCLAQLNRPEKRRRTKEGEDASNQIPTLERLRGSGSIEQDADTVLFIWRMRDQNDELTNEGALRVSKSRMGWTGTSRLTFDGHKQEFTVHQRGWS